MISNHSIKSRLQNGEHLNGCWIELFSPIAAEIVALGGYHTAFIDLEHGPGSYTDAICMMQAVSKHQCAPMIRASSSDIVDIKRTLDIGPEGIMIPNVRNADEAQSVVQACRYGPDGNRGAAPRIIRGSGYGKYMDEYQQFMDNEFLLIAQIETEEAVNDIDRICQVEGIDMLFIGPSDLSASLGALGDYDSTKFNQAYGKIEQSTLAAGKLLGTIPIPGRDPAQLFAKGHSLVISGCDSILLYSAAVEDVANLKKAANKPGL